MIRDHSQNHYGPNASFDGYDSDLASSGIQTESMRQQLAAKQAEVDALMLEYCPSEMSQEQLDNWAEHQQSRSFNDPVTDDDFLHIVDESNFAQERE